MKENREEENARNETAGTDLVEMAEILISLVARQSAILNLIRKGGLDEKVIEEEIRAAERKIQSVKVVGEVLAKRRLPPPGSLASVLKNRKM